MKKWIVLLVILILVVPYSIQAEEWSTCSGGGTVKEANLKSLIYKSRLIWGCSELEHWVIAVPNADNPKGIQAVFIWAVDWPDDDYQMYRIVVWDYGKGDSPEKLYWREWRHK